jgi:recombination protein RecA
MAKQKAKADGSQQEMSSDDVWSQMNKDHGGEAFFDSDDEERYDWEVIDYPCVSLGDATHHWGLPLGRVTQFHGIENSGKSFLAMLMVKETLIKYPKAFAIWIDAESSFDREWAELLGLDLNRVKIIEENSGADVFDRLCGRFNSTGKKVPGALDRAINGEIDIKIIVLDSIAALVAPAEEGRNFNEMEMGALPKFLKRAFTRVRPMLKRADCAFIAINQARDQMGFGAHGITYPGGKTWRHSMDFAIKLHPSTAADGKLEDSFGKFGHKIIATVEKCRGGTNLYQAEFWLDFRKGVVKRGEELGTLGAAYGVIERPNNTQWIYAGVTYRGKEAFFSFLEETPAAYQAILTSIKEAKASSRKRTVALSEEGVAESATSDNYFSKD